MIKTSYWKFSKILNIDEVIQQINSKLEKDVDEKSKIIINSIDNEDIIKQSFKISENKIDYICFKLVYVLKSTGNIESETEIFI